MYVHETSKAVLHYKDNSLPGKSEPPPLSCVHQISALICSCWSPFAWLSGSSLTFFNSHTSTSLYLSHVFSPFFSFFTSLDLSVFLFFSSSRRMWFLLKSQPSLRRQTSWSQPCWTSSSARSPPLPPSTTSLPPPSWRGRFLCAASLFSLVHSRKWQ